MALVEPARFDAAQGDIGDHAITPSLGYTGFAMLLLITIYFGALSCGTSPADLSAMTAWP